MDRVVVCGELRGKGGGVWRAAWIGWWCAESCVDRVVVCGGVRMNGEWLLTAGGEEPAVWGEAHGGDGPLVAAQDERRLVVRADAAGLGWVWQREWR